MAREKERLIFSFSCSFSRSGQLLQLTPAEEIVFRREDGETTGLLAMTNTATCNVAYKVNLPCCSHPRYIMTPSFSSFVSVD